MGAGCSRALSYVKPRKERTNKQTTPLDTDFLKMMKEHTPKRGWQSKSFDLLDSNWLEKSDFWSQGLESSIIKRVSHYDMLSSIHKDRAGKKTENSNYLNHLSHLITDYLYKCKSNNSGLTKRLLDGIYPRGKKPEDQKNRIVTFNYDLLIDRPLIDRGISLQKIYFDGFYNKRQDVVVRGYRDGFPNPLLLKLHGSLNWRCKQSDFERIIDGELKTVDKIPVWNTPSILPSPGDKESPLIIPPIPNKPITQARLFRHLWGRFLEYLSDAKRVVIIGYSCPETDVMARSIFTLFQNRKVEDIFIVDPSTNAMKNYIQLMDPKVGKNTKWHYYSNLNSFVENEIENQNESEQGASHNERNHSS